MTPARYLVDNSALARLDVPTAAAHWHSLVQAGLVGVSVVTELEVGFSVRSSADYRTTRSRIVERLLAVPLPFRAEARAREVQRLLVERGQHRAVGVADLLIAATAEIEGLIVLHYDADFDLVADVTGQPTEWVVPHGSIS